MKLSFSTLGCPEWGFERILDEAHSLGFSGIEVRGIGDEMRAEKIAEFLPGRAERTKELAAEHGLELCCFGTSVSFEGTADAALQEGLEAISVCANMGIPYIRVFGDKAGGNEDEAVGRVISGIGALCAAGRDKGVGVLLEVHGDFNTLERIQKVCEGVRSPAFGLVWDIANSDEIYGDAFVRFYEPIKGWIKHTHIKDCVRGKGVDGMCLPGQGDVPIAAIVNRLLDDGYDGYFSFEWEKKWHPALPEPEIAFPAYISLMKSIKNTRGDK